jgi:hypothetical protein
VDEEQKQNLDTWTEEQLRQYLKCNNHGQFSLSKQNRYNKHDIVEHVKENDASRFFCYYCNLMEEGNSTRKIYMYKSLGDNDDQMKYVAVPYRFPPHTKEKVWCIKENDTAKFCIALKQDTTSCGYCGLEKQGKECANFPRCQKYPMLYTMMTFNGGHWMKWPNGRILGSVYMYKKINYTFKNTSLCFHILFFILFYFIYTDLQPILTKYQPQELFLVLNPHTVKGHCYFHVLHRV